MGAATTFRAIGRTTQARQFAARFPDYRETRQLDRLRRTEYARLDRLGHAYLDYTGGSLYASSQLRNHLEFLDHNVLGNPHSRNPTSIAAEEWADEARAETLAFFNASPDEYDIIFTSNATNAIRLVGESYPFSPASCYLMTSDNHNSVNGVREFAARAGGLVDYVDLSSTDLRVDPQWMSRCLAQPLDCSHKLFAYPAQSNFSGVRHPAEWIAEAKASGWDVLWDCAAYAPTNPINLSVLKPDFVPISFYKMFGYPTGVGALIARREVLDKLQRPWFSGGTILVVSTRNGWFHRAPGHMAFEDGTIDYASLPAVTIGLKYLKSVGVETVQRRVSCLTGWLLEQMDGLKHGNGKPLVRITGPRDMSGRGATIAFTMLDSNGRAFDVNRIEQLAGEKLISVRTGCFCNPGAREASHRLAEAELLRCFGEGQPPVFPDECNRRIYEMTGRLPTGIRASLGIASNIDDCSRLMEFLGTFADVSATDVGGDLYAPRMT